LTHDRPDHDDLHADPVCLGTGVLAMSSPKRSTTDRGYDGRHKRERARWKPKVERGEIDCARCGEPIQPDEPWDLGHTDDRTGWTGPEHRQEGLEGLRQGSA
jgi:hypothetical protein